LVFRPDLSWSLLPIEEIDSKTVRAVRNHIRYVKEVSPWYQNLFAGLNVDDIQSSADIARLPLTDRTTLAEHLSSFLSVSPDVIAETVVTGGTTGKPLFVPLTANDLERMAYGEALSLNAAGVSAADRVHLCLPFDRMGSAAMTAYRGLTLIAANTCRIGVVPADVYRQYLELLKPTAIVGMPSSLKKLAADLTKFGFNTGVLNLEKLFCLDESIRTQDMQLNALGLHLEQYFRAQVYSVYSNTETQLSFCECTARCGAHIHPELAYVEIVDDNGNAVSDGVPGELVITPMGVEGVPLVRYKTGDITYKMSIPCECGRNSVRIGPILGRKSQLFKVQGNTVFSLALTNVLDGVEAVEDYLVILEDDDTFSDKVALHVVTAPSNLPQISGQLRNELHVNVPVLVSNRATIQHYRNKSTKPIRILDKRSPAAADSRR
jgi:phenylacetate-CoA ligase